MVMNYSDSKILDIFDSFNMCSLKNFVAKVTIIFLPLPSKLEVAYNQSSKLTLHYFFHLSIAVNRRIPRSHQQADSRTREAAIWSQLIPFCWYIKTGTFDELKLKAKKLHTCFRRSLPSEVAAGKLEAAKYARLEDGG